MRYKPLKNGKDCLWGPTYDMTIIKEKIRKNCQMYIKLFEYTSRHAGRLIQVESFTRDTLSPKQ